MTYAELKKALELINPNDNDEMIFTHYFPEGETLTFSILHVGYINKSSEVGIINFNNSKEI